MEWPVHRNVQEGSPVLRAFVGFVRYASRRLLVRRTKLGTALRNV